jgi:hypothetical protein
LDLGLKHFDLSDFFLSLLGKHDFFPLLGDFELFVPFFFCRVQFPLECFSLSLFLVELVLGFLENELIHFPLSLSLIMLEALLLHDLLVQS